MPAFATDDVLVLVCSEPKPAPTRVRLWLYHTMDLMVQEISSTIDLQLATEMVLDRLCHSMQPDHLEEALGYPMYPVLLRWQNYAADGWWLDEMLRNWAPENECTAVQVRSQDVFRHALAHARALAHQSAFLAASNDNPPESPSPIADVPLRPSWANRMRQHLQKMLMGLCRPLG